MSPDEAERVLLAARDSARAIAAAKPQAEQLRPNVTARVASAEEIAAHDRRADERRRAEAVVTCRLRSSVPPKYAAARVGDWSQVPQDSRAKYGIAARKLARAYEHPGIYALCGDVGPGKTHMACGLVNAFANAGRSARYVKTGDYIRDLRSTWKSEQQGAEVRFEREYAAFKLLVLDEWTVRNDTDNEGVLLLRLIDKRYDNGGTTVIVGNYRTQEDFLSVLDARIADRIHDGGGFILCDWPSLRGRLVAA